METVEDPGKERLSGLPLRAARGLVFRVWWRERHRDAIFVCVDLLFVDKKSSSKMLRFRIYKFDLYWADLSI